MRYQSFALFIVTVASVSAFPTQIGKRDFVNDAHGNIKVTCKISSAVIWRDRISKPKASLGPTD